MKKFIIVTVLSLLISVPIYAKSIYIAQSTDGIVIANTANSDVINGISVYIKGHYDSNVSSRTLTASCEVFADSMSFTTTGGLFPGTTYFVFAEANKDTITELLNFAVGIATSTPGVEGGLVISTPTALVGAQATTKLTAGQSGSCFGSSSAKTLTVTLGGTSVVQVNASSITFISTNGLYAGTTGYTFSQTENLAATKARLEAWPATMPGIDGTLSITIPQGVYDLNISSNLAVKAKTSIFNTSVSLSMDSTNIDGLSYIISARDQALDLLNCVVNATYGATLIVNIYDGSTSSSEQIRKETGGATTVDKALSLPSEGLQNTRGNALRIDLVGKHIANAFMNLIVR